MPPNHRCVKCEWVFKIKHNSVHRVKLVTFGYSQVPDVDFFKTYSPVVSDIFFRIVLLIMIKCGFVTKIVNVEAVLFYREPEKEIFVECPPGMKDISA